MIDHVSPYGLLLLFALLIMGCSSTRVQKYWTSGSVVNEEEKPVKGVSVIAKNGKKLLKTGERGKFSMRLRKSDTLIMNFSGDQIYVRGPNTMRGPHPVLILVDGVRVNSIQDVNPHNVKSLELVKSGYSPTFSEGSIGGVLKITTKDGK